jgi:hypothetical protein
VDIRSLRAPVTPRWVGVRGKSPTQAGADRRPDTYGDKSLAFRRRETRNEAREVLVLSNNHVDRNRELNGIDVGTPAWCAGISNEKELACPISVQPYARSGDDADVRQHCRRSPEQEQSTSAPDGFGSCAAAVPASLGQAESMPILQVHASTLRARPPGEVVEGSGTSRVSPA